MSGSEHYGKIMARSFSDRRLHLAGAHLAASGLVHEELAVLTVVGAIAAINFQLLEDGDSGILPGTGREMVRVAAFCSPTMADAIIAALRAADLLVEVADRPRDDSGRYMDAEKHEGSVTGLRLRGFMEANERILSARKYERSKRKRPSGNRPDAGRKPDGCRTTFAGKVQGSGSGSGSEGVRRDEESPPTPPLQGGVGDSASPEPTTANGAPRNPHRAAVYSVHGENPKDWPFGPSAWERALKRVSAEGVPAADWLDWLKVHRDDGPDEAAAGVVKFLEDRRKCETRHQGSVARGRAVVDEVMGLRVTLLQGMDETRREEWFRSQEENARDEAARERLAEIRRRVEGAA